MAELTFTDTTKSITIEAVNGLTVSSPIVVSALTALSALGASVIGGLAEVTCVIHEAPNTWRYRLRASDGRVFRQDLYMDTPDPGMTFTVTEPWRLSEFAAHRPLREACIDLILNHGLVSLRAEWA